MSSNRLNFTKRSLEKLPESPAGKRTDYYDTRTPGLVLRVTSNGTKSFSFFRRIDGRQERITLGRFPQTTVEQARKEVDKLNGKVAAGANPAKEKRGIRQEVTLGQAFEQYMDRHAKVHKKSWQTDESLYNSHLAHWKDHKLSAISRTDVQKHHAKIGANARKTVVENKLGRKTVVRSGGPGAANHMLRLLRTVYNKAILWGWEGRNPATGVKQYPSKSRDRFLQADELPRFFKALTHEPNTTARDFFLTALLTGARRTNVAEMRWDQVDLNAKTWRIPKTKNGDPQTIPLVTEMVELLRQRQSSRSPDDEWVFPGHGKTGHFINPDKAWKRILARAEIDDVRGTRIHDLRRSFGSWQAATGANLSVIGKTLNHRNVSTTAVYARLNLDPVRESIERATTAMLKAGGFPRTNDSVSDNANPKDDNRHDREN